MERLKSIGKSGITANPSPMPSNSLSFGYPYFGALLPLTDDVSAQAVFSGPQTGRWQIQFQNSSQRDVGIHFTVWANSEWKGSGGLPPVGFAVPPVDTGLPCEVAPFDSQIYFTITEEIGISGPGHLPSAMLLKCSAWPSFRPITRARPHRGLLATRTAHAQPDQKHVTRGWPLEALNRSRAARPSLIL